MNPRIVLAILAFFAVAGFKKVEHSHDHYRANFVMGDPPPALNLCNVSGDEKVGIKIKINRDTMLGTLGGPGRDVTTEGNGTPLKQVKLKGVKYKSALDIGMDAPITPGNPPPTALLKAGDWAWVRVTLGPNNMTFYESAEIRVQDARDTAFCDLDLRHAKDTSNPYVKFRVVYSGGKPYAYNIGIVVTDTQSGTMTPIFIDPKIKDHGITSDDL